MDNDSKNTLFGFEAITDIFSEKGQDYVPEQEEELDDEELEELKKKSAENRPATPGSKNKKNETVEEEEEEEEVEEEEEETEEEEIVEEKKTKSTSKKNKQETEEAEEEEENEEESSQVTALFDAIAEELSWEFTEEEEEDKPKTVEELVNYFKDVINEQSKPEYASEEVAKLDEFVRNGGRLEDYFTVSTDIDFENIDMDDENNQKLVLKELLAKKGYSDKQITKKIERFEDAGVLEDESKDAIEELQEIAEKEKERLLEDQKKQKEEIMQRQQKFFDDVVGEIKSLDNIRGIKIPAKDKKELLAYIFKADANGKTQYQKDYSKSVRNLIESAYFTMRGDTLLDAAKKQGTSSAIKNLKNSLRSTSVSKNTKRINSSSSNSIFSRAVQLL